MLRSLCAVRFLWRLRPEAVARRFGKVGGDHQKRKLTLNDPRKFKAPYVHKAGVRAESLDIELLV